VINTYDCPDTSNAMIRINPETLIFVPNAFTPDGDGTNEVFKPTVVGVKSFELRIFNRWGEEIFFTDDPDTGWDGTYANGTPADIGTYSWSVFSKTQNDDLISKTGVLNLIR